MDSRSFKEQAIRAYKSQKRRLDKWHKQCDLEWTKRTRQQFIKQFEREPDFVERNKVVIDGLEMHSSPYDRWVIMGICPHCGEVTQSNDCIETMKDIGQLLIEFISYEYHFLWECLDKWIRLAAIKKRKRLYGLTSSEKDIYQKLTREVGT